MQMNCQCIDLMHQHGLFTSGAVLVNVPRPVRMNITFVYLCTSGLSLKTSRRTRSQQVTLELCLQQCP